MCECTCPLGVSGIEFSTFVMTTTPEWIPGMHSPSNRVGMRTAPMNGSPTDGFVSVPYFGPFFLGCYPGSSFPVFPVGPKYTPELTGTGAMFPTLPPMTLYIYVPRCLPLVFGGLSSFVDYVLPLNGLVSSDDRSSYGMAEASAGTLPVPVVLSVCLGFFYGSVTCFKGACCLYATFREGAFFIDSIN